MWEKSQQSVFSEELFSGFCWNSLPNWKLNFSSFQSSRKPFPITLHNGLSIPRYSSNCDRAIYFQPSGESVKNICDQRDVGKIGPEQIQERIKWWKATAGGNERHRPWRDSTEHPTPQGHTEHRDHWPCLLTSPRSDVRMTGCRTG